MVLLKKIAWLYEFQFYFFSFSHLLWPILLVLLSFCPFVHSLIHSFFLECVQFSIYVIMCFIVYQKGAGIKLSKYIAIPDSWICLTLRFSFFVIFCSFESIFFSPSNVTNLKFQHTVHDFSWSPICSFFSLSFSLFEQFIAFPCECRDYNNFSWVNAMLCHEYDYL